MTKKIKNIAYSEEEEARYEAKRVKLSARLGVAKKRFGKLSDIAQ